jgi:N-formylmaleamate deformylase
VRFLACVVMLTVACGGSQHDTRATRSGDETGATPFVDNKGYEPRSFTDKVSGEGRPVIFIPGLGCPGEMFDGVVKHLAGRVEAHVLTLAGFAGNKPIKGPLAAAVRKDLIRYIRSHRLDKPILVGHSLGGFIAYWVAATAPDLLGGVVVIDAGPALTDNDVETARALRNAWAQAGDDELVAQIHAAYSSMVTDPKKMAPYLEAIGTSDRHTIGDAIYELVRTDLRDQLDKIAAPLLLVLADGSLQTTYKQMVKPIAHKQIVVVPRTKHFVWLDDPVGFDALLDAFLKNHEPKT